MIFFFVFAYVVAYFDGFLEEKGMKDGGDFLRGGTRINLKTKPLARRSVSSQSHVLRPEYPGQLLAIRNELCWK